MKEGNQTSCIIQSTHLSEQNYFLQSIFQCIVEPNLFNWMMYQILYKVGYRVNLVVFCFQYVQIGSIPIETFKSTPSDVLIGIFDSLIPHSLYSALSQCPFQNEFLGLVFMISSSVFKFLANQNIQLEELSRI